MKILRLFIVSFFVFVCIVPIFADNESDSDTGVIDMDQAVAGIMDSVSALFPDSSDDSDLDMSSIDFPVSSNTTNIVVSAPSYTMSELSTAFYTAIAKMEADKIDEYSEVTNISISPLWTGDSSSTPIPAGTLRSVLNNVIGPYSPVVVQYQYTSGSNTAYLREILPDYQWMFSCGIFALVLYCVFRLWGSILCRR